MSRPKPIWEGLSAREHEFQYNPQNAFPDFNETRIRRQPANAAAGRLAAERDIAYGDHELRKLDIYPARSADGPAPVHVFFHGGYWRAQDKENFAFVAGTLVPLGITTVIANYELCPGSTLDGVVDSALQAHEWICSHIGEFGGDRNRITLSGHSAGAHLGAEIIAHGWQEPDEVKLAGAVLTSGIFDPEPTIATSVNAQLNLDEAIAARHNVEMRAPVLASEVAILVGADEPWQWVDQSFRYYSALRRHDYRPALHVIPGYGHFDILDDYLDPRSLTVRTILGHCGLAAGGIRQ